jgi:cell division protein FtsZ
MKIAETGISDLQKAVDTLIIIPNQNLFRVANEKTTFADAFAMADQVLYSGVACITDLMVKEGLINLDFADVRSIMSEMGKAMMGTGEAAGDKRAVQAAEAAIANPLLDETSMRGARGLLISITGGNDLTLYEVDEAASRIRQEVDEEANIILGATFDSALDGVVRVSVVATGIDQESIGQIEPVNAQPRADAFSRARAFTPRSARPALTQADAFVSQEEAVAPAAFPEPIEARSEADEPEHEEFIPPAPEQPVVRSPRMPQIEDLPQLAQNQLRALRDAQNGIPAPETRRRIRHHPSRWRGRSRACRRRPSGACDAASAAPGFGSGRACPRSAAPAAGARSQRI